MSANERREHILELLNIRRSEKIENLAAEFGVTERTIRSDIEALTCCYPIKTKRGRYGGGVEVESWSTSSAAHCLPSKQSFCTGWLEPWTDTTWTR